MSLRYRLLLWAPRKPSLSSFEVGARHQVSDATSLRARIDCCFLSGSWQRDCPGHSFWWDLTEIVWYTLRPSTTRRTIAAMRHSLYRVTALNLSSEIHVSDDNRKNLTRTGIGVGV